MKRTPSQPAVDHVARATASWGGNAPDWVIALAQACAETSQAQAGKRINYSGSTISQVLSRTYRGDMMRMEEMVRGAFMAATVICPVQGEMTRNVCLEWQARPYTDASSFHIEMWRACQTCALAARRQREDAA